MPPIMIVFIFIVVAGAIAGAIFQHLQAKKRKEAFRTLAQRLGLRYIAKDPSIADDYEFLDNLAQGSNRYAFNILQGTYEDYPVILFDYHYETRSSSSKGGSSKTHHFLSCFILGQEQRFPELRIYPETLLSRLGQALGFNDIDFESVEFSKAFVVRSSDKKFAYDICHTRMMEYLLQHRDLSIEIEGRCVALTFNGRIDPSAIPRRLQQLVAVRRLFPQYLYAE